jgi:hypothetical protein
MRIWHFSDLQLTLFNLRLPALNGKRDSRIFVSTLRYDHFQVGMRWKRGYKTDSLSFRNQIHKIDDHSNKCYIGGA